MLKKIIRKYRQIKSIRNITGWNMLKAYVKVNAAKDKGITYKVYMKNNCWTMSDRQLEKLARKIEEDNDFCKILSNKTGWSLKHSENVLEKAENIGITNKQYINNDCWEFTSDELLEFRELLVSKKQKNEDATKWYINVVCEKTSWEYQYAKYLMDIAKTKGYTYNNFITYALYRKKEEEIKSLSPRTKYISARNKTDEENRRTRVSKYTKAIMNEMGWSLGRTRLETMRANIECGASPIEFYIYKIYKNGIEAGKTFITEEFSSKMKVRWCDWGGDNEMFIEKNKFNTEFKDFVHRKWFLNAGLTFEDFIENVKNIDKIIYKPLRGIEGRGIESYEIDHTEEGLKAIYDKICTKNEAIIEEYIKQHDEIDEFYPHAVNTIRVMSFNLNNEPKILNAVIKFATKKNVDNMYQGAVSAGVNVETGTICTDGVDKSGNLYKVHPYSGKEIKGFKIPCWDKLVETIEEASKLHSQVPYVGWDVSITNKGEIEIVEGNHNQGAYLIQFPFACCNQEGRLHTIEPYIYFD